MKDIRISFSKKTASGYSVHHTSVEEGARVTINSISLVDGDFEASFYFDELIGLAKMRSYFTKPLKERISLLLEMKPKEDRT